MEESRLPAAPVPMVQAGGEEARLYWLPLSMIPAGSPGYSPSEDAGAGRHPDRLKPALPTGWFMLPHAHPNRIPARSSQAENGELEAVTRTMFARCSFHPAVGALVLNWLGQRRRCF